MLEDLYKAKDEFDLTKTQNSKNSKNSKTVKQKQ